MDEKGKAIKIDYVQFDNDFYKTYIEGGKNVDVVIPMTTLKIDNTHAKTVRYLYLPEYFNNPLLNITLYLAF